jgi:hypothetical protein
MAAAASLGSESADILSELVSLFCILYPLSNKPAKGVVVRNDDSYVNVEARHHAALAARGPVVVESAEAPVAAMLRSGVFDLKRPTAPLKPELSAPAEADYETARAVLLRGGLVRTMAEEISLRASSGLLAESDKQIQLVAGSSEEGLIMREDSAVMREAVDVAWAEYKEAEGTPAEAGALLALLVAGRVWLEADRGLSADKTHAKGILLQTREPGMGVTVQTVRPDGPIRLLQGVEEALAPPPGATMLSLEANQALLQSGPETSLALDKAGSSATLTGAAATSLALRPGEAALQAGPATKLDLKDEKASIEAPLGVSLKQGPNSIDISAAGVKVTSQIFQSTADLTRLG